MTRSAVRDPVRPAGATDGDGQAGSPRRGWRREVRALRALWWRELLRLANNRVHMVLMLLNPLLFLLVLGTGLGSMLDSGTGDGDYVSYLFPGILLMAVQAPALAAGLSIVRDREVGLLRGVLVAPVRRGTLLIGKCLGSATAAALQGGLLLAFAGFAGLSYHPLLLLALLAELTLIALTMTAFITLASVWITRITTFQSASSLAMLPLFFLSGALFSLDGLPLWLRVLTLLNPLTYAVDALRQTVAHGLPAGTFEPGLDWGGWAPPLGLELAVMSGLGAVALTLAAHRFARAE
ncbi:ABC transporter permease [Streptomyces sp. XC 2026]|nr:ABC transporter permease [Streptomyces sp. XC 2026]